MSRGKRKQLKAISKIERSETIANFNIDAHFKSAIDYLDQNYAYFLTRVLNIGKPEWTATTPTACVTIPQTDNEDFKFLFNPNFAQNLTEEEMAFVLAHETMHILFNHIRIAKDYKYLKLFNISADCAINDLLVSNGLQCPEGMCRGQEIVGFDCANATVAEVYDALLNQLEQEQEKSDAQDSSGAGAGSESSNRNSQESEGELTPEQAAALEELLEDAAMGEVDDHSWLHQGTEAQAKQADTVFQDVVDNEVTPDEIEDHRKDMTPSGVGGQWAGKGSGGESKFMQEHGVSLRWIELLKELDPDIFKEPGKGPPPRPSYHTPRRKMQGFPDIILPVYRKNEQKEEKNKEKPVIVMALDTSGSISRHTANRFITLAKSIPQDKVKLHVCTFTTSYRELDLENPKYNSGGTNFAAVEQFIRAKVLPEQKAQKYPKAVVVITDGHAGFYGTRPDNQDLEKSWYWLLAQTHYTPHSFPLKGRKSMLDRFTSNG